MKIESAKLLKDAADANGIDLSVRDDYSGRGMFGKKTAGVVVDSIASVVACAAQIGYDIAVAADSEVAFEAFLADMKALRSDGMGRDIIVY